MAHWIFQGNPTYYRISDAIRDKEEMYLMVTCYEKHILPRDDVLVWSAGIYAVASVTEGPRVLQCLTDTEYWHQSQMP